jgi:hypothetical protein
MGSLKNGNQESRLQRQKWPSVAGKIMWRMCGTLRRGPTSAQLPQGSRIHSPLMIDYGISTTQT